jgi:hypothetical protein
VKFLEYGIQDNTRALEQIEQERRARRMSRILIYLTIFTFGLALKCFGEWLRSRS